jgi:hypothetical protein
MGKVADYGRKIIIWQTGFQGQLPVGYEFLKSLAL